MTEHSPEREARRIAFTRAATWKAPLENEMDDWWRSLDHLSFDSYDNSMEIYFEDHVIDLEPTPEQLARIWEFGFCRCWFNFQGGASKGGSERAYISPELAARIAAPKIQDGATALRGAPTQ